MLAPSNSTMPDLDAVNFRALARVVCIPEERIEDFVFSTRRAIEQEWFPETKLIVRSFTEPSPEDAEVGAAIRKAITALRKRDKPTDGDVAEFLKDFLADTVPHSKRRNRNKGFQHFIRLRILAVYGMGGHVTYDSKADTSTARAMIDMLWPLLPPRFGIPTKSIIQRACTRARKFARQLADAEVRAAAAGEQRHRRSA